MLLILQPAFLLLYKLVSHGTLVLMFESAKGNLFVVCLRLWGWILALYLCGRSISLQFTNSNKPSSFISSPFRNIHNPLCKMMWILPLIKIKWEENRWTRGKLSQYSKRSSRCRNSIRKLLQRVQAKTSFFSCHYFKERLVKCQAEKDDAEQRCKRLMQSMTIAAEVSFYLFKLLYSVITSWLIASNAIDAINQSALEENGLQPARRRQAREIM